MLTSPTQETWLLEVGTSRSHYLTSLVFGPFWAQVADGLEERPGLFGPCGRADCGFAEKRERSVQAQQR